MEHQTQVEVEKGNYLPFTQNMALFPLLVSLNSIDLLVKKSIRYGLIYRPSVY